MDCVPHMPGAALDPSSPSPPAQGGPTSPSVGSNPGPLLLSPSCRPPSGAAADSSACGLSLLNS